MNNISLRLKTISSLLKGYEVACDVGCDHGYTILEAFKNNYIKSAILIDNKKGPLEKAIANLEGFPCSFYLSNGVTGIDEKYDVCIVSGMGVENIIQIVKEIPKNVTLILEPNTKVEKLRRFLYENNYTITNEIVVFDGFYYVILTAKYGKENYTDDDVLLGKYLPYNKESKEYFSYLVSIEKEILKKNPHHPQEKMMKYSEVLHRIP